MKRILLSVVLVLGFLFGFIQDASATHLMGADISYECISPGQYRVHLTLFRDCNGIDIGTTQTVNYSSSQCGVNSSITVTQVSQSDITPVCQQNGSTACGGSGQYGVEKHVYEGILNLPAGCGTDWILDWAVCCRNYAITNLADPGNEDMHIQSCTLDNTLSPCNNSPVFLNDPVPFFCTNQPVHYNHGVIDVDGDSLVFTSVSPMNAGGLVVYAPGLSATVPFICTGGGPFSVNAQNGDINFTPSVQQIAVTAMRVDEYRNGIHIGCVMRDMQFTIINCNNQLPTATGTNGSNNFTLTLPACSDTCFTVLSNDPDAGDVVTMDWNSGIPGASFTIAGSPHPTGTFCWSTSSADLGTHYFTVHVEDNHCPITGSNTYSFTLHVIPSNDPPVNAGPDVTLCPGLSTTLTATVTGGTPTSYHWSDGTNSWNTQSITVSPSVTTIYTVSAYYPDGCTKTDAVVVNRTPNPNISIFPGNITLCNGGSVSLIVGTTAVNPTYHWTPTAGLSCTNCGNPTATPLVSTQYCVYITDAFNCPSPTVCSQINLAAPPPPQSCAVIYATTTGNGVGTKASPASLQGAINLAQCNNSIIKLGAGTYTLSNPITNITSYTTIEGGFNPVTWIKTSAPGATTIYRNNLNPEGPANAPRIVAIYMNSQNYFRFQDITFQTQDCPATIAGQTAMSNYVFHMTNCNDYNFTRCQMLPGKGGDGIPGTPGVAGAAGSPGSGGSGGSVDNSSANVPGGNGGNGGGAIPGSGNAGGTNNGNGSAGTSSGDARSGGGGGGGGAGGEGSTNGGSGGGGGGVNGGGGPGGGGGGTWNDPGGAGASGIAIAGTPGTTGISTGGTFVGGFYVPGGLGGNGTNGTGGTGGSGGGGGGGQSCFFCIDGTGNGGGGGGGGGQGGTAGTGGSGGGGTIGVYMFNNGANGIFDDCNFFLGTAGLAGAGGLGGAGGTGGAGGNGGNTGTGEVGAGGNGANGGNGGAGGDGGTGGVGTAGLIYVDGGINPIADIAFNLAAQPVINADDVSCTYRNVNFTSAASNNWNFDLVASPQTAVGASVITQYTTFGRKNITYGANTYTGFFNVPIDANSYIPDIATNATQLSPDTFFLCQGSSADFNGIIPGADIFDWNFGGAVVPNTYNGPAATTQNLTGLTFNTAGTFKITLRINTSCCGWSPTDSIYMIVEPNPTLAITGLFALCPGDSVHLHASGSVFYQWSPPYALDTLYGPDVTAFPGVTTTYLLRGYSLHHFCQVDTQVTITVTSPPTLTFTSTPANCGNNGSVTVNPNPVGTYSYLWNDALNQTTQTASPVPPGSYAVTVTDLLSNCSATSGTAVGSGAGLQSFIDSSQNVSCNGACDGLARARGILGSGTFSYAWSNGGNTRLISGLCAGTYTVTVTDVSTSCSVTSSVTISEPPVLFAQFLDTVNATCAATNNGSALANAGGGTGPYQYVWNDPNAQDSAHAVNLYSGIYTVTVIDQHGCTVTATVPVLAPPPVIVDTLQVIDVSCNGAADGAIILSVSGGVYPYSYVWQQIPAETDSITTNIAGGNYTIVVADVWQCKDTIVVPIVEPALLVPSVANTDSVKCFGGSDGLVDLSATGGTSPYQYSLDGITFQASASYTGLAANNYTTTVRDAHLCTNTVPFTIYQPTILVAALQGTTDVKCFGGNDGTATITINGGTPTYTGTLGAQSVSSSPYTFTTLAAGNYTITATDANACTATVNAVINEPTQLVLSLVGTTPTTCFGGHDGGINVSANGGTPAYLYSLNGGTPQASGNFTNVNGALNIVGVIDANLCIDTLHINVPQPLQTTFLDTAVIDVTCFGGNDGSIDLTVTGTSGPWTYLWSNGFTTQDISNLTVGVYKVTVSDNIGCTAVGIDSIVIAQPADLALTQVTQNVSCFGGNNGSITVTAIGGVPTYVYAWSSGQNTAQISNLTIGSFNITVTDAHNCTETLSNILVTQPALLTVSTVANQVSCPGFSDGSVIATAVGGTPAYNYNWNPAAPNSAIDANIPAGVYNVTVTDANSCTATSTNTVIELPGIVLNANVHNVLCDPLHNGFIDLSAQTFNPPASYHWSNGATTQDIFSLYIGVYAVTITDANNCSVDTSFTVLNDSAFTLVATPHETVIDLGNSVDIIAVTGGGTLANIIWTPSEFLSCGDCLNPNASPVNSIYYIATATSDSGCVASDKVVITVVPDYNIFIPNVFTPNGDGNNDFFEVFGNKKAWKQFEVQVFNRWGEKVYESGDMNFKWDGIYKGQPSPQSVYVYQIHLVYLDNYTDKLYKGSVTLVR